MQPHGDAAQFAASMKDCNVELLWSAWASAIPVVSPMPVSAIVFYKHLRDHDSREDGVTAESRYVTLLFIRRSGGFGDWCMHLHPCRAEASADEQRSGVVSNFRSVFPTVAGAYFYKKREQ